MKILAITETWLSSHIYDNEVLPSNFNIYRKDRDTCGGGVMLAVDQSIPTKIIPSPDNIEVISVHLLMQHPVKICVVYNPPNSERDYQHKLISFLCDIIQLSDDVIILGDFNVPNIDWSSLSAESGFSTEICEFIFQYNLSQVIIMSPTHNRGNILDLVIVSNDKMISNILIHSESTIPIKSDHFPVTFKLMLLSTNHNVAHKPIHILDYCILKEITTA